MQNPSKQKHSITCLSFKHSKVSQKHHIAAESDKIMHRYFNGVSCKEHLFIAKSQKMEHNALAMLPLHQLASSSIFPLHQHSYSVPFSLDSQNILHGMKYFYTREHFHQLLCVASLNCHDGKLVITVS